MNVVKIKLNDIEYVLKKDVSYSVREYCRKNDITMVTGIIPDDEKSLCLKLEHFVEIANGGRARCTAFNFEEGEWEARSQKKARTFRSSKERAIAIRMFIKDHLLSKEVIDVSQILEEFGGLGVKTIRRHIRDTIDLEGIQATKETADKYVLTASPAQRRR